METFPQKFVVYFSGLYTSKECRETDFTKRNNLFRTVKSI